MVNQVDGLGCRDIERISKCDTFFPSEAVYATASFLQWLKTFAKINPEAYAVDALKGFLFKGAHLAGIATDIAFLLVFTIVMMTTVLMTFIRMPFE